MIWVGTRDCHAHELWRRYGSSSGSAALSRQARPAREEEKALAAARRDKERSAPGAHSPGMRICQLIFEQTLGTAERGYKGQFAGQTSK
jgi:hypothetical protein